MTPIFDEQGRFVAPPQAEAKPYAVFAFHQPDYAGGSFPVYTIRGGPSDGSSVTRETLDELNIPIVRES